MVATACWRLQTVCSMSTPMTATKTYARLKPVCFLFMKTPFRTADAESSLPGCPVRPPRSSREGNSRPGPARGGFSDGSAHNAPSEPESRGQVERGALVGANDHRVDRGRELQTGSRGEDGEPQPSPDAVVPGGCGCG